MDTIKPVGNAGELAAAIPDLNDGIVLELWDFVTETGAGYHLTMTIKRWLSLLASDHPTGLSPEELSRVVRALRGLDRISTIVVERQED